MASFDPLVGTRHTDPDNGLVYETTEVKVDRQGYIVAYRRLVIRGKLTGKPDGPNHVSDIESYTELDLDRLSEAMRDGNGKASAPDFDEKRGRTGIEESGAANTGQDTSEALQKAPSRASVIVGRLHKSSSLIDQEGRSNLSNGYQQGRKTVRIAKHT